MYQKDRLKELNHQCLCCIRDFGSRDPELTAKTFNIPVNFVRAISNKTDQQILAKLKGINLPIFSNRSFDDDVWDILRQEFASPMINKNKSKLNLLLSTGS